MLCKVVRFNFAERKFITQVSNSTSQQLTSLKTISDFLKKNHKTENGKVSVRNVISFIRSHDILL